MLKKHGDSVECTLKRWVEENLYAIKEAGEKLTSPSPVYHLYCFCSSSPPDQLDAASSQMTADKIGHRHNGIFLPVTYIIEMEALSLFAVVTDKMRDSLFMVTEDPHRALLCIGN